MSRFTALSTRIGLLAATYVAGCLLPGEPSAGERIEFRFGFTEPYRVPIAGSVEPTITIFGDGRIIPTPGYRLESLDTAVVRVDASGHHLEGVARGPGSVRVIYETPMGAPDTVFAIQGVVAQVRLNWPSLALPYLGARSRLYATARDAQNVVVPNVPFTWSITDPTVATVNDTGLVTGIDEGTTILVAAADGLADSSQVVVTQAAAAVRIAPELDTVRTVGRWVQFFALAIDSNSVLIPTARPRWTSSDTTVARIDSIGRATARGAGTTRIIAHVGAAADTALLVVAQVVRFLNVSPALDTLTAIADSARIVVLGADSLNFPVPHVAASWTSSNSSIARVDSTGLVTAVRNGVVLITATSGPQSAFATVVVRQQIIAAHISPDSATLIGAGDTLRFSAVALDRNSFAVNGTAFTWRSTNGFVASVDTTGLVTARVDGVAGIVATAEPGGQSDTATASVTGAPPPPGTLLIRTTTTGILLDSDGYSVVVDGDSASIGTNDSLAIATVAGLHLVSLSHVAGNCSVADSAGRSVGLSGGDTARVDFAVTCAPPATLLIRTTTTGGSPDPDGYTIGVDNSVPFLLGTNDSSTVATVAGAHQVSFTGIAVNCSLAGSSSRTVIVAWGDTARVDFDVTCVAPATLLVRTTTTGPNPDPDGYLVVVDEYCYYYYGCSYSWTAPVGVTDSATWTPAYPGSHWVGLSGLTNNCTVTGLNPVSVTLSAGVTTTVSFTVTCVQTGSVRVTTATTGADLDPDGYGVSVNGSAYQYSSIGTNASHTFDQLLPGNYGVQLESVAGNCSISGSYSQPVTVVGGATADVAFGVTCEPLAAIRVAVTTTGVPPDADGYFVSLAGPSGPSGAVLASNGTAVFGRLLQGAYTVQLSGVALNCTVTTPDPFPVTVAWGDTADAVLAVACVPPAAIRVTVATTGVDPDPDGYNVTAVGGGRTRGGAVAASGVVVIDSLIEGTYTLRLWNSAVNCAVTGSDSLTVFVAAGDTADVTFDVGCTTAELLAVAMYVNNIADIYLVKSNGTGLTRLTNDAAGDYSPAWSAASGKIAFVSLRDGNNEIYVMNADGSGQLRLTANPWTDYAPVWSPDGLKLAFTTDRDGNHEIYVMNADGSNLVRLTNHPGSDLDPAWSPDGLSIAFASTRDNTLDIYRMNANGSGVTRLTFDNGNRYPDWSPAGTKIAYSHTICDYYYYYGCVGDLGVINPDGTGGVTLPTGPSYEPAWSPDGRWIAFGGSDYYGVFGIRADGTGLVRMVPGDAFQPAWRR